MDTLENHYYSMSTSVNHHCSKNMSVNHHCSMNMLVSHHCSMNLFVNHDCSTNMLVIHHYPMSWLVSHHCSMNKKQKYHRPMNTGKKPSTSTSTCKDSMHTSCLHPKHLEGRTFLEILSASQIFSVETGRDIVSMLCPWLSIEAFRPRVWSVQNRPQWEVFSVEIATLSAV